MFNSIYCEVLKLRKSYFYLLLAGIVCFLPATLVFGWGIQGKIVEWNDYIFQVEQVSFLLVNTGLCSLVGAYIYTREFSCNTAGALFSYPVSRIKIFLSKFLVIIAFTMIIMFLQVTITILSGFILPHEAFNKEVLINHLRINFYGLILQYAILPIAIFIALISKNIIMPIVYSGLLLVINMAVMGINKAEVIDLVPSMYPIEILFDSVKRSKEEAVIVQSGISLPYISIIIAASIFVIGMTACIIYYAKTDVN